MNWLTKLLVTAALAEAAVALAALLIGGPGAMAAAFAGSGVALAAQVAAVAMLRPGLTAPSGEFMKRWAGGIAARGASFVVVATVIIAARSVLPPAWVAAGYLAMLLTLLFAETVFLK